LFAEKIADREKENIFPFFFPYDFFLWVRINGDVFGRRFGPG